MRYVFQWRKVLATTVAAASLTALTSGPAGAASYDQGANDKEIVIGNFLPYSGPASAYGTEGKAMAAYFDKVNAEGGVNGRKIKFISYDDGYTPAKAIEQTRKLVEQDGVLLMFAPLGTASNAAIQKYLNSKKVPQLFINSGASRWGDPKNFPWSIGFIPTYRHEGAIYAQHILESRPNAKVAILYQNDDFGRDYLKGFLDRLGSKAETMVVAKESYEFTDATINSQLNTLKGSGADTFLNISTPKFAAQAIRKVAEIGWKPTQYVASVSGSIPSVLKPAGVENAIGLMTASYIKDPVDPRWKGSKELEDYLAVMKKYYPGGDPDDPLNVAGYTFAQIMVHTLKQAGDNLTRENIMKQAANLNTTLPMLYPGIQVKSSPDDFYPIKQFQLMRFDGTKYETIGNTTSAH